VFDALTRVVFHDDAQVVDLFRRNNSLLKSDRPSGARQTISPTSTHDLARTASAISSAQHRELLVDVAAAGPEPVLVAVDVGKRAEPVVFQLEQPIAMGERIRDPHQRHRTPHEGHGASVPPRRGSVEVWLELTHGLWIEATRIRT
jgi:hypothetical protein